MKKEWIKILGLTQSVKLGRKQEICEQHFETRFMHDKGACKYLRADAVPTIFASSSKSAVDEREPLVALEINLMSEERGSEPNLPNVLTDAAMDWREPLVELDGNLMSEQRYPEPNLPNILMDDESTINSSGTSSGKIIIDTEQGEGEDLKRNNSTPDLSSEESSQAIEDMNLTTDRKLKIFKKLKVSFVLLMNNFQNSFYNSIFLPVTKKINIEEFIKNINIRTIWRICIA